MSPAARLGSARSSRRRRRQALSPGHTTRPGWPPEAGLLRACLRPLWKNRPPTHAVTFVLPLTRGGPRRVRGLWAALIAVLGTAVILAAVASAVSRTSGHSLAQHPPKP